MSLKVEGQSCPVCHAYLFDEDDFSEYDFEDDVDETFYNPYTGCDEFESEDFTDAE